MGQCQPECCGPTEGPMHGPEDEDHDDVVATDEASIIQLRSSQTQVGTTLVQQISLMEHSSPHKLTGDWDLQPPFQGFYFSIFFYPFGGYRSRPGSPRTIQASSRFHLYTALRWSRTEELSTRMSEWLVAAEILPLVRRPTQGGGTTSSFIARQKKEILRA
eukprot:s597_g16.t1